MHEQPKPMTTRRTGLPMELTTRRTGLPMELESSLGSA